MFDSITRPIQLPPRKSLIEYEGKGNYAISKYYDLPYRPFYRKKLYMVRSLLDRGRIYKNILDFGSGPGIFTHELKKHACSVTSVNETDTIDPRSRFECIIAASTFEFIDDLNETMRKLHSISYPRGQLIVASPMQSFLSEAYFVAIGDNLTRNSPESIQRIVSRWFKIDQYKEWMGLYFAFKGYRR